MTLELNIIVPSSVADENNISHAAEATLDSHEKTPSQISTGGWKSAYLLLVNQGLTNLAFFGVGVNLVLFLIRVLHYENANAADTISKWTGTVYLFSLLGAFLSDSYLGRYLTCIVFQLIFLMGLMILSLSSWFLLIKPEGCGDGDLKCMPTSSLGNDIFNVSIYCIALGYGGYQPALATFGADQFSEADPLQARNKTAFFCYFYFALNAGQLFSNTILVYFEDRGEWVYGFWAAAAASAIGVVLFLVGTHGYIFLKPCGNPLTRIAQVFVATCKKWNATVPTDSARLYELEGSASAIKGSRKILHTEEMRCLDKAAMLSEMDFQGQFNFSPWRLCTVTQVEEVKRVIKMLPIWLCTIIYSVIFTQMASLFVEQGAVMKCNIGKFHFPAASVSIFDVMSVLMFTFIYEKIVVPVTGRCTGNPKGLSEFKRMGVGLVLGILAMVAAGVTELERLKHVIPGHKASSLSVFWQIPQYTLVGASEVFMYVGQLDFFNSEAPVGLKSFGSSLLFASMSLGNYASSVLVNVVMIITTEGDKPGWIPHDLNSGHIDRFYFLICALAAIDFVAFLFCAKRYKFINLENDQGCDDETQKDNNFTAV